MSGPPVLRAVLFDFDGLIVDTESAIYQAWRELYESQGHSLRREVYVQCVGSTFGHYDPMAALEELCGGPVDWGALLPVKDDRIVELQRDLGLMPGVRELLRDLRSCGIARAVASSSSRQHVLHWLERTGIPDAFDAVCTRDDVLHAKPAPDLFLTAMHRLRAAPEECLVLEDSVNGLRAAMAAGVPCVNVPSPVTKGSDFTGAAAVLESLEGVGVGELRRIHREAALRASR